MKNVYWYLFFAVIFLVPFIYTFWKKRNRHLVILYFFVIGLVYLFEYNILVIFRGYSYHPGVFNQEYFDNIMGAVFSDAFYVPMSAIVLTAFRMNLFPILLAAELILGVEKFFLKLGIYTHYWWNTAYTGLGLIILFYLAGYWYRILQKPTSSLTRFITLYFINIGIHASLVFILVALFKAYFYTVGWFADPVRGHIAFATLYILVLSIVFVSLITFKVSIIMDILIITSTLFLDFALLRYNILHLSHYWSLGYFFPIRLILLAILWVFNNYLQPQTEKL